MIEVVVDQEEIKKGIVSDEKLIEGVIDQEKKKKGTVSNTKYADVRKECRN